MDSCGARRMLWRVDCRDVISRFPVPRTARDFVNVQALAGRDASAQNLSISQYVEIASLRYRHSQSVLNGGGDAGAHGDSGEFLHLLVR